MHTINENIKENKGHNIANC